MIIVLSSEDCVSDLDQQFLWSSGGENVIGMSKRKGKDESLEMGSIDSLFKKFFVRRNREMGSWWENGVKSCFLR